MAADSGEDTILVLFYLPSAFDIVDHSVMINRLHVFQPCAYFLDSVALNFYQIVVQNVNLNSANV